jgi:hypothetical protein
MLAKTTTEGEGALSFDTRVKSRVLVRCSIEGPVIRDVSFFIRVFHLSCCQSLGIYWFYSNTWNRNGDCVSRRLDGML